ncbi:MAG: alpha/beta fold hydrolase [Flavisolibacter sp.]
MKIYFISGLGADSRIFKNIVLPPGFEAVYLDWIPPHKKESLSAYALRLAAGINTGEEFSLIGLSLGGMMAVEIALRYQPRHTILVSSVPLSEQLPFYYRALGGLRLHHLVPVPLMRKMSFARRIFGPVSRADGVLLENMIRQMDVSFVRWAIDAILKWENRKVPSGLVQIHGEADEILPLRLIQSEHIIPKAGHIMILNRASEINEILEKILKGSRPEAG